MCEHKNRSANLANGNFQLNICMFQSTTDTFLTCRRLSDLFGLLTSSVQHMHVFHACFPPKRVHRSVVICANEIKYLRVC